MNEIQHPNMKRSDEERPMSRDSLIEACRQFLQVKVPRQNIIDVTTFEDKYAALFNAAAVKEMGPKESERLFGDYNREFSLRHPIKVYGEIVDDPEDANVEVIYVEDDQKYHRVMYSIPPIFGQLRTLNEFDNAGPALIDSFFNYVAKSDNPIAKSDAEMYGAAIVRAIAAGNPDSNRKQAEAAADAVTHDLLNKRGVNAVKGSQNEESDSSKKSQSDNDGMVDCLDWF